ncbi:MAG: NETI motif-containing protein [Amphibacillus sp.]|nr:NETI motif-containing protein [Amphibacillus sp.]
MSRLSKKNKRNQKRAKSTESRAQKKQFELLDGETLDQCLERIKQAGYIPIRRMEKPIFEEIIENSEKRIIPIKQQIIFEVIMNKDER